MASTQNTQPGFGPTAPTPALLAQINANNARYDHDQGSDEFRSVIDDLTVQNQKLRKKLRTYERLHCSHLQKEKLFEVTIHGLPAHKKRELEHTLRSFASSINDGSYAERPMPDLRPSTTIGSSALHNTGSSSTSETKPIDSAYASMSGVQSAQIKSNQVNMSRSRQNDVKPDLNDIPEMLGPSNILDMSDKAKSKLVVRRLEQIFTGRGAASDQHAQSQQQQEVSTAAAEHERSKIEACGQRVWREGTREAHILPDNADLRVYASDDTSSPNRQPGVSMNDNGSRIGGAGISRTGSPEQRPTRPLDLDIHRAQVPSDNIEYIRHLGLVNSTDDKNTISDGDDGWIYLNLLFSMAQLHTFNVTPEFIRKALKGFSQKFELSQDGTKVRWLGGTQGSWLSTESDEYDAECRSYGSSLGLRKRGSFDKISSKDDGNQAQISTGDLAASAPVQAVARRQLLHIGSSDVTSRFHYKPLFLHSALSDDADSGIDSDAPASTNSMEFATGINSSSNAADERQQRLRGRKHDSGPMIFYQRAKFCTDLGGDPSCTVEEVSYNRVGQQPVGCSPSESEDSDDEGHGHRALTSEMQEFRVDSSPTPLSRSALDLDDLKTSISDCTSHDTYSSPLDMEASGLGGIHPTDNFVVSVQTQRKRLSPRQTSRTPPTGPSRRPIPKHLLYSTPTANIDAFHSSRCIPRSDSTSVAAFKTEILSAVKKAMPPSALPPPSYAHQISSDDSSEEENDTSEESSEPERFNACVMPTNHIDHPSPGANTVFQPPTQYFEPLHNPGMTCGSSEDTEANESTCSTDDESDVSIDLLAHARLQDPEAVRAKEVEWEERGRSRDWASEKSLSVAATGGESESDEADSMSMDNESDSGSE